MNEEAATQTANNGGLVVHAVLRTDVGLVRSENQDFGTCTTPAEEIDGGGPGGRLLVVADGMGGHRGGATASRLAAETLKAQYLGSEETDIATALREALTRANARVFSEAQANPDLRGMGTTMSALAIRGSEAWFAHVGDSRIYLVRRNDIRQLTDDHSLVASMVREGLLTKEEAENHPRRNVLQRSVGVGEQVDIDVRGPLPIRAGDTFVICSDGLHGLVKEPELKEIAKLSIEEAADAFVKRALDRGAPDNVTVIVARVENADGSPPSEIDESEEPTVPMDSDTIEAAVAAALPQDPQGDETAPMLEPITEEMDQPERLPEPSTPRMTELVLEPEGVSAAVAPSGRAALQRQFTLVWVFLGVLSVALAGWWLFWSK